MCVLSDSYKEVTYGLRHVKAPAYVKFRFFFGPALTIFAT